MRTREFYITGYKPAYSKQANELIKAFDLGVDGAFVKFAEKMIATLEDDVSPEQLAKQPSAIQKAYEEFGCINVSVSAMR